MKKALLVLGLGSLLFAKSSGPYVISLHQLIGSGNISYSEDYYSDPDPFTDTNKLKTFGYRVDIGIGNTGGYGYFFYEYQKQIIETINMNNIDMNIFGIGRKVYFDFYNSEASTISGIFDIGIGYATGQAVKHETSYDDSKDGFYFDVGLGLGISFVKNFKFEFMYYYEYIGADMQNSSSSSNSSSSFRYNYNNYNFESGITYFF